MIKQDNLQLPWRVSELGRGNDGSIAVMVADDRVEDGALVARVAFTRSDVKKNYAWTVDDEKRDDRAAFIVRAANSHHALVEALRDAISQLRAVHSDAYSEAFVDESLDFALKLAEEG